MSAGRRLTRRLGIVELILAAALFGVAAFVAKRATRTVDGGQVAFLRYAIGLAFVLLQALVRRAPLRPERWGLLVLRGLFGGLAGLLYYLSLAELPVGTATLLNCTSPIWTALLAVVFLSEQLPLSRGSALAIAVAGVLLVVYGQGQALGGAYAWQGVALLSGVAAGAAIVTVRAARKTDGPWEIFGVFCLVGMAVSAPVAAARWQAPDGEAWGLLVAVGLITVLSQILLTHALAVVEAATSVTISQVNVLTSLALGAFIDGDPLTWISGIGMALALAGIVWIARQGAQGGHTPVPLPGSGHRNR